MEGLLLGILGVMFLYLFFLFLIEKKWIQFYLSIFVLGMLLLYTYHPLDYYDFVAVPFFKGYLNQFHWGSLFLDFFGLIKFTETYFNISRSSFISRRIIPIYLVLLAFLVIIFCIDPRLSSNPTLGIMSAGFVPIGILITLALVILSKKQEFVSRRYYLFAFSPVLILLSFSALRHFFPILSFEWGEDLFSFSLAFVLVMLSLTAGIRNNGLKAEKEKALQKNLEDQQRNYESQQRVNQAISRFVPTAFLNALGKSDITEIKLGESVEKEVSVLFSDIRDFTGISEQMTPEENFAFVNDYNKRMGPIIQEHGGFINQYLGDGIMAMFPESIDGALQAAIQMGETLRTYNTERAEQRLQSIKVGIGIHSGPLIMGITGDENRMDAATISDVVNSASRIESLTKHYGANILLSEESLEKLEDAQEVPF